MNVAGQLARLRLLSASPRDYLYSFTYSPTDPVTITGFNPKARHLARKFIARIKNICPGLETHLLGSVGLGISGQNDIDLYLAGDQNRLDYFQQKLTALVGRVPKQTSHGAEWKFTLDSFPVDLVLTAKTSPHFQSQIRLFKLLQTNLSLLQEYADLKSSLNGKPRRRYIVERMIFFNRVLAQVQ